jgi:hypothetical protein
LERPGFEMRHPVAVKTADSLDLALHERDHSQPACEPMHPGDGHSCWRRTSAGRNPCVGVRTGAWKRWMADCR